MISALLPNYNRADLAFERGEGAWLWTTDGRRFLDFGSGIATASLGHGNKHLADAISAQAHKVMHVSNLYRIPQAEQLAARLVEATFADTVFFCNSGAEANEGMIKMVRKTMASTGKPEKYGIICFEGAFHGRTLATLAATGNSHYLEGFGPKVEGFKHVPLNNMNAVRDAIDGTTAAVMVEPVQGEGGMRTADIQFMRDLRAMCDEFGLIMALDEVQCGMGRTGKLFAHEWAGIEPDVISAAKGIGGGFPLGAVLAKEWVGKHLVPGTHGTTYGGNPLACTAGNAVLDVLMAPGFLDGVIAKGELLKAGVEKLIAEFPGIFAESRGRGLMQGIKCVIPAGQVQVAFTGAGLMTVTAGENVVRLVPPLVTTDADIAEALGMMRRAASDLATASKAAAQ